MLPYPDGRVRAWTTRCRSTGGSGHDSVRPAPSTPPSTVSAHITYTFSSARRSVYCTPRRPTAAGAPNTGWQPRALRRSTAHDPAPPPYTPPIESVTVPTFASPCAQDLLGPLGPTGASRACLCRAPERPPQILSPPSYGRRGPHLGPDAPRRPPRRPVHAQTRSRGWLHRVSMTSRLRTGAGRHWAHQQPPPGVRRASLRGTRLRAA